MSTSPAVAEFRVDPDEWSRYVADTDGPQVVVGGPGTGKTEFLVRRALHLLDDRGIDPDSLLVLSFGRRGVADLSARIRSGLERSVSRADVTTFHAFAARVLEVRAIDRGWEQPPAVLTGPEQVALVHALLRQADPGQFSPAFREVLTTSTFAAEVTDFVLRCREQLLTPAALTEICATRAEWRGLADFVSDYDDRLRASSRIDYGTLLAESVWAIEDDPEGLVSQLGYVLVDEYQDTTPAQARLLRTVTGEGAGLTVAADPYQSIYSFRGASVHNVANFPAEFGNADHPARRLVLTTSFRTPRAVLDAAVRITAGGELPGAAGPVRPAAGEGRVDVHRFDQETEEAEWIASELLRLHLEERIAYSDIAVFVRSKRRFLPDLSRALARRGIPHDTPDSRLTDHPAVRFVLDAVVAATTGHDPEETRRAVRRLLLGSVYQIPLGVLREIERRRGAGNEPWDMVIRATSPELTSLADLLSDPAWADAVPAVEGFWHVWSTVPQLAAVVGDPDRAEERAAWASLSQVLSRWNERNPDSTLDDYRRLTEEEDFEARPLLSYLQPTEDRLVLTTLHQSKGLEFDVVFIADAVEGVFPDLRTRDSLLGVRHLLDHIPTDPAAYRLYRLQEERRLAYTAMTRAARRVVWTSTATGFEEGRGIPSRFLALVAGTATVEEAVTAPPRRRNPVTPQEAEAELRRRLQDPAVGTPERLAALSVLADPGHPEMRSPEHFAGVRSRGDDRGLIPDELRMSPSQAEAYAACPRRYALERRLGVGNETTVYAAFGTLVHRVLELTEAEAREAGLTRGTADRAVEILDAEFDPGLFGGEPFSVAWHRRAVGGLRHLYDQWPSRGTPVALERRLELELGGVRWLGYADRIEQRGDQLTIVDYKTSKNPPSVAAVKASLQLAYYVLAATADPELSELGRPTRAEMWFPLTDAKKVTTRALDLQHLSDLRELLIAAADGIRAEQWQPRPSEDCDRCRVRFVCPEWPEGREAFTS
jgi:superfamily I DNA/RNA helicase/RecB family exonuclease